MKKIKKLIGLNGHENLSSKSISCSVFGAHCDSLQQRVSEQADAAQKKARGLAKSLTAFNERTNP